MIRINLLPHTKRVGRRSGGGSSQYWMGIYAAGFLVWCSILGVVWWKQNETLHEEQRKVTQLQAEVDEVKKKSGDLKKLKEELEESEKLQEVVDDLNRARTGPTRMMLELINILSRGRGPTIDEEAFERLRRVNPHAQINEGWDVRRLWLTSFNEVGRRCKITGQGRSNDDVAEFQQRLVLSQLFDGIVLERTEEKRDTDANINLIEFELSCEVKY